MGFPKALLRYRDETFLDTLIGLFAATFLAMRGGARLSMDLLDCPETIDEAMVSARAVFPQLWDAFWQSRVKKPS